MSHFYVKPENIDKNSIYVNGEEAHHILDVMRLEMNDEVIAFDGLGNEYTGHISEVKGKSLKISIHIKRKQLTPDIDISLAQAIPKKEKMDYIIQKCTELGVSSIIPMVTERTVVKIDKKKETKRHERWVKIAREASKQCGRGDIPKITDITNFKSVLESSQNYTIKLIPSLIGGRKKLLDLVKNHKNDKIIILIGPEGGFSQNELKLAVDNKFTPVSLGSFTLKSDTAAIATVAILNNISNYA